MAPGQVLALDEVLGVAAAWEPPYPTIYVLHLDVPSGVSVESRSEFFVRNECVAFPGIGSMGHASMPVYKALIQPGEPQVHLGTDLGTAPSSRTNVAVYNAGTVSASARIEIRRTCDNSIAEERTVVISPNTTIQIGGLSPGLDTCTTGIPWLRYTVVTVDQPSLSFVSSLTETPPNVFTGRIPTVDLAIAQKTTF
jgi:hypothetical protein